MTYRLCVPQPEHGMSDRVEQENWNSLDELEALLVLGCQKLMTQHDLISGLTCYHWWPKTRVA
ncbi:hypothetical protein [Nostoc favosum]|uniref:Transposase n=1 Tax=Nostoc favosum CHAB5714 TaxID=2780399 RepID=A0ABS8IH10_9NOSO|nr:hypothetical protein [Nostoc favosum]MCC5603044.1 hypothetical protein [Nostoc favosum CHAB5714]